MTKSQAFFNKLKLDRHEDIVSQNGVTYRNGKWCVYYMYEDSYELIGKFDTFEDADEAWRIFLEEIDVT